jgi:GalNAc-alpha-(1->4)-GalNAc-alpha-(1->3)-diNAcBac-PP-undecaprenol alpha-1,4-N-acetyl-D-galactosaminyltransferase
MGKKKLCLLIPSLQAGGMERVMSELADYFCQKNDLQVHLILYGREPELFYNVPDNILIHRPELRFNDRFRQISAFRRLLFLRRTLTLISPDAILSFGEYWNSFVLLSLTGLSYRVFISDRCSPAMEFSTFHKFLRRILYRRAEGVIAQTEKAKILYSSQFRNDNICVIGNPIRKIADKNSSEQRENIILTVGRLIKSKHHDKMIEIFARISNPTWKLIIVGEDALKQKNMIRLKELIQRLNMNDRIFLAGNQANVDNYYLNSKIFAFASSSEGFPNVIGEAMSARLPVIAFNCVAGPEDLIQNGQNGFLVPLFNYEEFGSRLKQLMEDEDLCSRLGTNGRETIQDYSLNTIGSKFYDFIFEKQTIKKDTGLNQI